MSRSSHRERLLRAFADRETPPPPRRLLSERRAAIALILLEVDSALEFLLIERATRGGDPWSGQMALPGGHEEAADADLGATAERETFEEVGLDLRRSAERMGRLSVHSPARGIALVVEPYVYLVRERPTLTLSEEVRQVMWVPVGPLARGERRTVFDVSRAGQKFRFPAWDIDGHPVWGLTYRVLDEFLRRFDAVL